jgi:hypothetical protein
MSFPIPPFSHVLLRSIVSSSSSNETPNVQSRPVHQLCHIVAKKKVKLPPSALSECMVYQVASTKDQKKKEFLKHHDTDSHADHAVVQSIHAGMASFGKRFNAASTSLWSTTTPLSEQRAFARSSEHRLSMSIVPSLKSGRLESLSLYDVSMYKPTNPRAYTHHIL